MLCFIHIPQHKRALCKPLKPRYPAYIGGSSVRTCAGLSLLPPPNRSTVVLKQQKEVERGRERSRERGTRPSYTDTGGCRHTHTHVHTHMYTHTHTHTHTHAHTRMHMHIHIHWGKTLRRFVHAPDK